MAESFFHRGILSKAWTIAWTNKSLWFFGLFAAILSLGEEYDVLIRNGDILDSIPRRLAEFRTATEQGLFAGFGESISNFVQANVPGTISIAVSWLIAILALAWLVIVSQGALIEGARRHQQKKSLNILQGFDSGMSTFWPIFLVNIIAKVVVYGLMLVVIVPLFLIYLKTGSSGLALAIMLWTFVVLFPVIVIVAFVTKFAYAYIVIKRYRVMDAIGAGWNMLRRNWLITFELAFLLMLINFAVVYVTVSTMITALGFPDLSTLEYLIFIVAIGFVFAWLTTFQFSSWTFLFIRIEQGEARSKLRRLIDYIFGISETTPKPKPVTARSRR